MGRESNPDIWPIDRKEVGLGGCLRFAASPTPTRIYIYTISIVTMVPDTQKRFIRDGRLIVSCVGVRVASMMGCRLSDRRRGALVWGF